MKSVNTGPDVLNGASITVLPGEGGIISTGCSFVGSMLNQGRAGQSGKASKPAEVVRGDGKTVSLEGEPMVFQPEHGGRVSPGQRNLSFFVRARDPAGRWQVVLLREFDEIGRLRSEISISDSEVIFELYTDYRSRPLRLVAPLGLIGATQWHDIVGRYSGPNVQLFVDGLLVDEDWPIGALTGTRRARVTTGGEKAATGHSGTGVTAVFSCAAIWDRAIEDSEILALSADNLAEAERSWGFSNPKGMQYSQAPNGAFVGDCLPFFHDGVYHFYYLLDRRNHRSKFGLGAHQWAHASSGDLVNWVHHPLAIPITEEHEGSICTGSVFFYDGVWYGFYATRMPDRSEHLSMATSSDGIHFTKLKPNPFASPGPPYKYGPFRDPHVFKDPNSNLFHMLVTAELANPDVAGRGGCLAHFISTDLRSWEQKEPFFVSGYGDQPECSELFEWNGWYYLVFSHFGVAHYRMSRSAFGPWTKPAVDSLDGPLARVMKSAWFSGDRRIGTFFLDAGRGYAGCAVFREFVQMSDGTLASKWPTEMVPALGGRITTVPHALGDGATSKNDTVTVSSPSGFGVMALGGVPQDYLLRCRIIPKPGVQSYGIGVRGTENFRNALLLEFEPARRKIGWRENRDPSWREDELAAIYEVTGLDGAVDLEVLVFGNVLDVCVNGTRTLINRSANLGDGSALFLYCQNGDAEFEHPVVRPILDRTPD